MNLLLLPLLLPLLLVATAVSEAALQAQYYTECGSNNQLVVTDDMIPFGIFYPLIFEGISDCDIHFSPKQDLMSKNVTFSTNKNISIFISNVVLKYPINVVDCTVREMVITNVILQLLPGILMNTFYHYPASFVQFNASSPTIPLSVRSLVVTDSVFSCSYAGAPELSFVRFSAENAKVIFIGDVFINNNTLTTQPVLFSHDESYFHTHVAEAIFFRVDTSGGTMGPLGFYAGENRTVAMSNNTMHLQLDITNALDGGNRTPSVAFVQIMATGGESEGGAMQLMEIPAVVKYSWLFSDNKVNASVVHRSQTVAVGKTDARRFAFFRNVLGRIWMVPLIQLERNHFFLNISAPLGVLATPSVFFVEFHAASSISYLSNTVGGSLILCRNNTLDAHISAAIFDMARVPNGLVEFQGGVDYFRAAVVQVHAMTDRTCPGDSFSSSLQASSSNNNGAACSMPQRHGTLQKAVRGEMEP